MKKTVLFVISMALIVGCASTHFALMKNPQTGDIRECKIDPWKNWPSELDECKQKYEKLGYIEVK